MLLKNQRTSFKNSEKIGRVLLAILLRKASKKEKHPLDIDTKLCKTIQILPLINSFSTRNTPAYLY